MRKDKDSFRSTGSFVSFIGVWFVGVSFMLFSGCSHEKEINRAKMSGVKYWVDKAHPGKAYDVQVTEAIRVEDGKYRVKALVDGEQRVGVYDPRTETFDEGFYTLAHEKTKKVAELEEENRYLKGRVESLEKELYQLKLRFKYVKKGKGDPEQNDESQGEEVRSGSSSKDKQKPGSANSTTTVKTEKEDEQD